MVSNKDILRAGVDVVLDGTTKPLNDLVERIALGSHYHKIKKAKKLIKDLKEVM